MRFLVILALASALSGCIRCPKCPDCKLMPPAPRFGESDIVHTPIPPEGLTYTGCNFCSDIGNGMVSCTAMACLDAEYIHHPVAPISPDRDR